MIRPETITSGYMSWLAPEDPSAKKRCSNCGIEKPLRDFRAETHRDRPSFVESSCRSCEAERRRKWRQENKEREKETERKWRLENPKKAKKRDHKRRRKQYGLSREQFEALLLDQQHKCASCGKQFESSKKYLGPHVDHCHKTGVVRGLLCHNCNIAEGFLGSLKNARALVAYMEKSELFYSKRSDRGK